MRDGCWTYVRYVGMGGREALEREESVVWVVWVGKDGRETRKSASGTEIFIFRVYEVMRMFNEPGVSLHEILGVLIPIILLSLISYRLRILDARGTVVAVAAGLIIGLLGNISWLVLLLFFMAISFGATRFRYAHKHERGTAEGHGGTRRSSNVIYNGIIPVVIAVLSNSIGEDATWLYITAIAAAASDTLASEIGVLSDRVYLITNPARNSLTTDPALRIEPGVNGGVSALGTGAALAASLIVSVVGWILIPAMTDVGRTVPLLLLPALFGFMGCHVDSLLGATLEARKLMSKGQVNLTEIAVATLLMYLALPYL